MQDGFIFCKGCEMMRKVWMPVILTLLLGLLTGCAQGGAVPGAAPQDTPMAIVISAVEEEEGTEVQQNPVEFDPSLVRNLQAARLTYAALPVQEEDGVTGTFEQTLTDVDQLARIETLLSAAQPMQAPGKCPYGYAFLTLMLADGTQVTVNLAADSCMQLLSGGVCYDYTPTSFLDIPEDEMNNSVLFNCFGEIPRPGW